MYEIYTELANTSSLMRKKIDKLGVAPVLTNLFGSSVEVSIPLTEKFMELPLDMVPLSEAAKVSLDNALEEKADEATVYDVVHMLCTQEKVPIGRKRMNNLKTALVQASWNVMTDVQKDSFCLNTLACNAVVVSEIDKI